MEKKTRKQLELELDQAYQYIDHLESQVKEMELVMEETEDLLKFLELQEKNNG